MIQELIQQLVAKAGLTEAQAQSAATVMQDFVKSKVPPQFADIANSFFAGGAGSTGSTANTAPKTDDWADKAKDMASDASDKLSDFAAKAKDKAEDFAEDAGKAMKDWAGKAEDMAEDALEKLKGMFGDKKDPPAKA